MEMLYPIYIALVGLCLGSFATALAYRFKHHLPWAWGGGGEPVRSMCPPCGRTLTIRELIPIFSWIMQRGRCQCGKNKIPVFYPAVELITMIAALAIYALLGWTIWTAVALTALPFVVATLAKYQLK